MRVVGILILLKNANTVVYNYVGTVERSRDIQEVSNAKNVER